MSQKPHPLDEPNDTLMERLERSLIAGRLDRRGFMRAAAAAGFSTIGLSALADELDAMRTNQNERSAKLQGAYDYVVVGAGSAAGAGAWATDQDDILGPIHELTAMQGPDGGLVYLAGGEVEARKVFIGREACRFHVIGDGAHLAFSQFGFQELRQDRNGGFKSWGPLFDQILNGLGHAIHLQAAEHDDDGRSGGVMTHGGLPRRSGCAVRHSVRH